MNSAPPAWFPDVLASWYDTFSASDQREVESWRYTYPRLVDAWAGELLADPHGAAARIQRDIESENNDGRRLEAMFRALQASSRAIERAGVAPILEYASAGWAEIRAHWWEHGNLARTAPGFVLPRRGRRLAWHGTKPEPKIYHPASLFPGFLRPDVPRDFAVAVRTMPDVETPIETLNSRLRVAVAPLIHSMDELLFQPIDDASGRRAFRVALREPARTSARAMRAICRAGRLGCDLVVLPELCLSADAHCALQDGLSRLTSKWGGRPWLVVAGSALTLGADGSRHNRSLVLSASGRRLLTHDKLFPYEMSRREADRYGIGEALRREPRVEDISVATRRLEILECPLGRTAVVICEDLSNFTTLAPLAQAFEIDWLVVPVMDGVQTTGRWTARYAEMFSREFGTNVIVATCGALLSAHRRDVIAEGGVDPGSGCALFSRHRRTGPPTEIFRTSPTRSSLAVFDVTA